MMFHPATEFHPPFSSPTISSVSSSGFDTESTGSFFHDHSITLGALMGVTMSFPTITFRTPPHRRGSTPTITLGSTPNNRNVIRRRRRKINTIAGLVAEPERKRVKRRNWWSLCSGEESKPSKLWEFLEVERRFEVDGLFTDALMDVKLGDHQRSGGRRLFANGRVLPPPHISDINEGTPFSCSLCRFPVFLSGICGGGGGGVR